MEVPDANIATLRAAYDKVKAFPDASPEGWAWMLELRRAVEGVIPTQHKDAMVGMIERGARQLALSQSGVDEWDNYDPAFQTQLKQQAEAVLRAALNLNG